MQYRRSRSFRKDYESLPEDIKEVVREKFKLFQEHPTPPYHPSLRIKPMKGWRGLFEGHVSLGYVFTFHSDVDPTSGERIIVFRRIGRHDIYKNP